MIPKGCWLIAAVPHNLTVANERAVHTGQQQTPPPHAINQRGQATTQPEHRILYSFQEQICAHTPSNNL
jgi:hypothetical protein